MPFSRRCTEAAPTSAYGSAAVSLTLPDPVPDVPKRPPPRQARPAQRPVYDPHAFYPDEEGPEFGA